jgi:hypothetical protein
VSILLKSSPPTKEYNPNRVRPETANPSLIELMKRKYEALVNSQNFQRPENPDSVFPPDSSLSNIQTVSKNFRSIFCFDVDKSSIL